MKSREHALLYRDHRTGVETRKTIPMFSFVVAFGGHRLLPAMLAEV
jgi:hypothetical protein